MTNTTNLGALTPLPEGGKSLRIPTVQTQIKHANRKLNIDSSDKAVQRMRHLDAGAGQRIDEVFK
jgi:hypothetical protein